MKLGPREKLERHRIHGILKIERKAQMCSSINGEEQFEAFTRYFKYI